MSDLLDKTGSYIVGWNDILGFKRILEKVPHRYLDEVIVPRMKDLKENLVRSSLDEDAKFADVKSVINMIEMRVISDTLAVICPITDPAWPVWLAFLEYSSTLYASMFEIGLPLRGSVSCGELCVQDWGVFGAAVVRAHEFSDALDISACVLLPDAVDAMHSAFTAPEAPQRQSFYTEWDDVPMKHSRPAQRQLVQIFSNGFFSGMEGVTISDYARDKFSLHGKSIESPSVKTKLDNTISFLQWNRWLLEHGTPGQVLKVIRQRRTDQTRPN